MLLLLLDFSLCKVDPEKKTKVPRAKPPKKTTGENDDPAEGEQVEPADIKTLVLTLIADVRKEAGAAKGLSDELNAYKLSSELAGQLAHHSKLMYAAARKLQELINDGNKDIEIFQPYLARFCAGACLMKQTMLGNVWRADSYLRLLLLTTYDLLLHIYNYNP